MSKMFQSIFQVQFCELSMLVRVGFIFQYSAGKYEVIFQYTFEFIPDISAGVFSFSRHFRGGRCLSFSASPRKCPI